jgi:hypothetical protein
MALDRVEASRASRAHRDDRGRGERPWDPDHAGRCSGRSLRGRSNRSGRSAPWRAHQLDRAIGPQITETNRGCLRHPQAGVEEEQHDRPVPHPGDAEQASERVIRNWLDELDRDPRPSKPPDGGRFAQLRQDPLGGPWWDGRNRISTRELSPMSTAGPLPILTPGCLEDGEVLALLDERGAYVIPQLRPFLRV